jgi:hypothetical protein
MPKALGITRPNLVSIINYPFFLMIHLIPYIIHSLLFFNLLPLILYLLPPIFYLSLNHLAIATAIAIANRHLHSLPSYTPFG